jgi:hypothetical protein
MSPFERSSDADKKWFTDLSTATGLLTKSSEYQAWAPMNPTKANDAKS